MELPQVGDFELERELAPAYYVARWRGARVIVSVIRPLDTQEVAVRHWFDESRIASWFVHPNLAGLLDMGLGDDHAFYVYEHVPGGFLRDRMAGDLDRAVSIARHVGEALAYLHQARSPQGDRLDVVHRDVSPYTIYVTDAGSALLFETACMRVRHRGTERAAGRVEHYAYLSPEQCRGQPLDQHSDQYQLASVLWDLSVGEPRLSRAEGELAILEAIAKRAPERPSRRRPDYPPDLEEVVMRALAPHPEDRFDSVRDFRTALSACRLS